MQRHRSSHRLLTIAILSVIAAGCGGGDDDDNSQPNPPAPPPPPPATPGDTSGITSANRLVTFDRASRAFRTGAAITGLQSGENIVGADLRAGGTPAGQLYALGSTGRIYTVDTTTGAATLKSTLAAAASDSTNPFTALDGTDFGVDFNPVADRLRVVSNTGQNLRIDVETGATTTDAPLNVGGAALSGATAAAYTNDFADACSTALYYLDSTGNNLLSTSDPNGGVASVVGALGVDADAGGSLEITTAADGTNSAVAVLAPGGTPTLYTVDLGTGVATSQGAITGLDAGETLRSITGSLPATSPTQSAGNVVALTDGGRLVTFNNTSPQKLCTTSTVSGLQAGESLHSIDARPSSSAIYGLGSSGRIYSVNVATGAATQTAVLVAAAPGADPTDPFTTLSGTHFAFDFTPVLDQVRAISDTGQNLRINVDTGVTLTDALINPAGSALTAMAYTPATATTPPTTTLFAIDATGDRLVQLGRPSGNPSNGDFIQIGLLGIGDIDPTAAMEIVSPNNSAFAALSLTGSTTSDLYTVNLQNGAATRVNTIGGAERVRGLAFSSAPLARVTSANGATKIAAFKAATNADADALKGLQGGEQLSFVESARPGDAYLVITDAGRAYAVNAAGTATLTDSTITGIVE